MHWIAWLVLAAFAQERNGSAVPVVEICGTISRYRPGKSLYMAMYTNEENFRKQKYYKTLRFTGDKLPSDSVRYCFSGVEAGEYMIVCFQDINGDGRLNYGMFGIPSEPYCFFRPYGGMFRPHFDDCKVTVTGSVLDADMKF
jgi:uncharacterized protein (DUF2141 family)